MEIKEIHNAESDLLKVFSDKQLLHYTDLSFCDTIADEYLQSWIRDSWRITWAGYEGSEFVGFVSVHIVTKHRTASITIVILEKFQRQSFARQLLQHAIKQLQLEGFVRFEGQICTENNSSVKLFESLGFRREGVLRKNFLIDGVLRDSYMYAKIVD